jgi:TPR repeat protein
MAVIHYKGLGVNRDLSEAFMWFLIARGAGSAALSADKIAAFEDVGKSLTKEQLESAQTRASAWLQQFKGLEKNSVATIESSGPSSLVH